MKESYAQARQGAVSAVRGYGDACGPTDALDGALSAARRGWTKARANGTGAPTETAASERLRDAFRVFTDAAARLEETYAGLRARVEDLSMQLASANEALTRQLADKETLLERQSALLAAMPAGVLLVDAEGTIRVANAAAGAIFAGQLVGRTWIDLVATLEPAGSRFEWTTRGDAPRRINLQDQPIDASGERIVLVHDVTDAHAARVEQERNERLAAMGEMAARMAHQLRTPLATAMLYASRLGRVDIGVPERTGLSEKILARLRSLERMTREMLRFVRGEQPVEQSLEVSALLSETAQVVEPLMSARGIRFLCEDHTAGAVLHGDRRGLGVALLSLLENAAQATAQGGKVRIAAMANSTRVRLQVCDSGAGIARHALPHLFEPFYSTRAEGTGLGLAIVKSVVEAHGGSIDVDSTEGAGTSFTVTLPCSTETCADVVRRPGEATEKPRREHPHLAREAA